MLQRGKWTVTHRRCLQYLFGLVVAAALQLDIAAQANAQEAGQPPAHASAQPAAHAPAQSAAKAPGASHGKRGTASHASAPTADEPQADVAGPPTPVRLVPESIGASVVVQRFTLAPKVTEFLVVVYGPSLEGVQLRTPAGQLVTADNIWRVGRWQTGSSVSVISLDWSSAGQWMVLAPAPVPVAVIVDPMLVPLQTPELAQLGQPTTLRWQMQAGGRALDLTGLAEIVVVSARVVDEAGTSTPLAYSLEANGVVAISVPPHGPGIYNVETDIWLATFGQHVLHRLSVAPAVKVQMLGRRAAPTIVVRVQDGGLKREATRVALSVTRSDGATQTILGMRQTDGSFRLQVPAKAMGSLPARAQLVLSVDGLSKAGQPWQTPPRQLERSVMNVAQPAAGARPLPDGQEHPAQGGAAHAGTGEHASTRGSERNADDAQDAAGTNSVFSTLLTAGPHAPGMWHYSGLALANLILVGLIWRRHKLHLLVRVQKVATTLGEHGPADSSATDAQRALKTQASSAAEEPYGPPAAVAASDPAPAAEPAVGSIEPLELDALADLAERAEAQSDARSQRTSTEPDVDVAA